MEIHLISYGDKGYELRSGYFKALAVASSFFDKVTIFRYEDFDIEFEKEFHKALQLTLGGGVVWRPYFIKRALQDMEDGDILVYGDPDFQINKLGRERFDQYLDQLNQSETGVLGFQHSDLKYTKREVFDYFNAVSARETGQLISNVIFLKKCNHSVQIVDFWNDTLSQMLTLPEEEQDPANEPKDFMGQRQSQGIWTMLLKIYAAVTSCPD
ncbi:hypothetical protein [Pedobacter gandavensis]|uniref:hypothetical protein n=1 Tax=Pedobacter gandavensis TaxID=2679963 RepID=UPI00292EF2A1|nr:hypothetical protein [Pedobacter gandavensis]